MQPYPQGSKIPKVLHNRVFGPKQLKVRVLRALGYGSNDSCVKPTLGPTVYAEGLLWATWSPVAKLVWDKLPLPKARVGQGWSWNSFVNFILYAGLQAPWSSKEGLNSEPTACKVSQPLHVLPRRLQRVLDKASRTRTSTGLNSHRLQLRSRKKL